MQSRKYIFQVFQLIVGIFILHLLARENYLLFHILIELFSIIIAFALFTITWHARRIIDNKYLLFIGIAAFFIGSLDLLHTLTYPGMNIIPGEYMSNQFWIATRFLEAATLLAGFLFIAMNWKVYPNILLLIYVALSLIILASIMYWKIFPVCYIEGVGQTRFKIISEYVIIAVLLLSLFFLFRNRSYFYPSIFNLVAVSIIFTAISEFFFTLYFSNYGLANETGHFFKLLSFFLIYKANVETAFIKPAEVIYSELKNSREAISQYNRQLRNEINTRDKLFSIIAHDLRSPFTAILGFSDIVVNELEKYDNRIALESAKKIYATGNQTLVLLENLLQWAQLKKGMVNPHFERTDMKQIVNEVESLYSDLVESKNILLTTILTPGSLMVTADKQMVMTIVRNLVGNAIKFTRMGGTVTIKTIKENSKVIISVIDNGLGIPPEVREKLFAEGSYVTTKGTANERGSGLGLIIVREFVELNRGEIWLESEVGKGSTFSFSLPAAE